MAVPLRDFADWLASGQTNGYYFKSTLRFIPGENNAFFWKPLERPGVTDSYVQAEIFEEREGQFIPSGRTLELSLVIYAHDRAIPAHGEA